MDKKVILLNGASSSGKSTLANNVQSLIRGKRNEEYVVISIDDFLEMSRDEKIYEDDVYEINSKLCDKAIETLKVKDGIIIDHVITSERIFNELIDKLKSYKIYLIHVTCPLKELIKRESERKNRCLGSAEESNKYLYPKDGYSLKIDTFELSAKECGLKIIDLI